MEIPPKRDIAGWRNLREKVDARHANEADAKVRRSVRKQHDLEQRIRELENRPKNSGRDRLVKELRKQLAAS